MRGRWTVLRLGGSRRGLAAIAFALGGLLIGASSSSADAAPVEAKNVQLLASTRYDGGGELAADGRYIYSSEMNAQGGGQRGSKPEDGGLHIFDTKLMREVGFLHCPGTDNDIEMVNPNVVAMAFGENDCAPFPNGLLLIDVKDPRRPKVLSALQTNAAHTLKPHPDGKHVYMGGDNQTGSATPGMVIVDVSDPKKPVVAATAMNVMDCHDVSFTKIHHGGTLAFCAGAVGTGEVQIWDASNPLKPTIISRIINPAIQYSHYAVANRDGSLLAIDDEAFAVHDCNSGMSPTGRAWIYDISDPAFPVLRSSIAPPRGGDGTTNLGTYNGWIASWCTSHGLDWHPKKNVLAVTWFTGGFSVLDLTDPAAPAERAAYQAPDSATYSVLWHAGRLATNDHFRGFDLFRVKNL